MIKCMSNYRVLAINPGSTSTKIAIFSDAECIHKKSLDHSVEELKSYTNVASQFDFRLEKIREALAEASVSLKDLAAIIGRGGVLRPIESGVYAVNDTMCEELRSAKWGEHASNLGAILASSLAKEASKLQGKTVPAYIADPVVVDEMEDQARLTGLPQCKRLSVFHALNHKAIAREYASRVGKPYEELNVVVAHLGGGISIGAHRKGRVIDVNNALVGEGPFSPERAGTLPTGQLIEMCFSGKYTQDEMKRLINGKGGLVAHMGSNDARKTEEAIAKGDAHAKLVYDALCYAVAKWIGAMAVALEGKVDAILLTGGMAHSKALVEYVRNKVSFIAPVEAFPGEDEMRALALNALRAVKGETQSKTY